MTGALSEGNIDEALRLAEEGSSLDQEQNSARRINEYGLRKATILLKKGDWELASSEYNRLIERNPDDGNLYVKASEAMLSQKQGARAAHFANLGIARAKTLGSRDLQNACQELLQASARYQ